MDLIMPGIDGVEATRRIMAETPCPILVVTATVSGHMGKVYEAMGHGALDAVDTPRARPAGAGQRGDRRCIEKIATVGKLIGKTAESGPCDSTSRPAAGAASGSGRSCSSARRRAARRRWPRSSPGSPAGWRRRVDHRPARRRGLRPRPGELARRPDRPAASS